MKKILAAGALSFAISGLVLAAHDMKPKHGLMSHRHADKSGVQPFAASPVMPRVLDHRDPTRPGGLDPSFNPPPT